MNNFGLILKKPGLTGAPHCELPKCWNSRTVDNGDAIKAHKNGNRESRALGRREHRGPSCRTSIGSRFVLTKRKVAASPSGIYGEWRINSTSNCCPAHILTGLDFMQSDLRASAIYLSRVFSRLRHFSVECVGGQAGDCPHLARHLATDESKDETPFGVSWSAPCRGTTEHLDPATSAFDRNIFPDAGHWDTSPFLLRGSS